MENVEKKNIYNFKKALEFVKTMSSSQGFYGRIYSEMIEFDRYRKASFTKMLKKNNVKNDMDLIFLFEC